MLTKVQEVENSIPGFIKLFSHITKDPGDSLHFSTQPGSLSQTLIILIFKR